MPYQKIAFKPGIYKDDSPLEAEGYWIDADKIRFVRGLPETIYGWEKASSATLNGICRGAMTWATNARNPFAAFGTNLQLYAMDVDGNVTDITPHIRYGQVSNPFTTTNGTATTVTMTGHGLVAGQLFTVVSQSSPIGGITLAGAYPVVSVTDANNFVITTVTATAAGPGGGTVNYAVGLVPGQTDGLGGLGYGTGGFGDGGYSGSASGYTLYPQSWSLAQWGQNLIANPRGGGIYEWAPNVTAMELVSDTTFATGWTLGSGWSQAAGTATAATASSPLSIGITCEVGAWHLLQFDMTRSAGTLQPQLGSTNIGSALSTAGHLAITFFAGSASQTLNLTGASFSGTITNPSVKVLTVGNQIANAPTVATCVFTTAERILVACGVNNDLNSKFDGSFDAMRVAWSDQEANQTWTPAIANLAGSYTLSDGSRVVRGLAGSGQNVILTDTALYTMRYVPDPSVVYDFTEIASGCGLIGPNAICQAGGIFYWMDAVGGFWSFDGSFPQPLRCTMARDVRDNLAFVQQDKVYAFPVTVNGRIEVWWLVPDLRDGNECSRYVAYAITESQDRGFPVWFSGMFNRTAWTNGGIYEFPLAVDTSGAIWFHEKGFTQDGAARSWSITSAYFDLGDGDAHMRVVGIQPDADDLQGGYAIQVDTNIRNGNGISSRTFGPYNVIASTGKVSARANGQEAKLTFAGAGAPTFWRLGTVRLDLQNTMRRR